jgi:putative serine protease PepD
MPTLRLGGSRRPVGLTALVVAALAALAGCGSDATPSTGSVATTAMRSPVSDLQQQFVQVVRTVSPKVVQIQSRLGLGSGVVFDGRGDIVTNAHVVDGAKRFAVTLPKGDPQTATLVGADKSHDLAVVHLDHATPAPAKLADSSKLQVGDLVLAIGNPLGLRSSVSEGIVSSLDRSVPEGNGVTLSSVIQTSAAINPGNSGGALVDLTGTVIGVPTLAALDPELGDAQASGIGFAIPSNTVKQVATKLIAAN